MKNKFGLFSLFWMIGKNQACEQSSTLGAASTRQQACYLLYVTLAGLAGPQRCIGRPHTTRQTRATAACPSCGKSLTAPRHKRLC